MGILNFIRLFSCKAVLTMFLSVFQIEGKKHSMCEQKFISLSVLLSYKYRNVNQSEKMLAIRPFLSSLFLQLYIIFTCYLRAKLRRCL